MQLNRVSAPNEGAAGMDVTNDAAVNGAATEGRAAIAMVRTPDVKVWRGRELGDKARLRIAPPPGKVISQPIKGGWFSRIRQALQARSQRVQEQSAQRLAALNPEQSTAPQSGPQWLRGLGTFRGRLKSLIIKLRERAMPRPPVELARAAPGMQTIKTAAAVAAAAVSNASGGAAKDSSVYRTVKTPDPNAGTDASSAADSAALAQATAAVQQRFAAQAADKEAFTELLQKAFGDKFDAAKAETIRQQALAGDFSWAPKVQVVDSKTLADTSGVQAADSVAHGAYVADTDTIYLSRELLHSDPAQAQRILMEEIGHGIDARLNTSDTVGDEGEVFAKLMHGDHISTQEMAELKAENDKGVVNINGRSVAVEYGLFKKLKKAISGGIKKVVKGVVKGVVNLAKSAVKVGVGLVTFDFKKVKEGVKEGANAIKTAVKTVAKAIKETASEIHKISKEAFKKLMQSKLFATVLAICRFIPIPIVQLVVRIIDVVRAAYMVYQGIKNKSLSMVLGGVASLASGGANLAGSLGASAATVNTIKSVADAASKVSMAYNAVANKDIGAAMGLLGGAVGGSSSNPTMNTLVTVGGYAQQAIGIGQAIKNKDALGALGGVLGAAGSYNGDNKSELGQQLATAQEVVTGARAIREISRGNLDAAQSLAAGMGSAQRASQQADAISAQRRAEEERAAQAANNRSLLNEADKDLRSLPAEQEGVPVAADDSPAAATAAAEEHRNGSDVDSDNTAARNGGVGPSSSQTLLTVNKGQTLEGIARAQYGENWKAGLAQMVLDNGLKLNQWGSPILGVGKTLVLNDISGKSEQELASLSRTGGRIISNNDKGLQAKADLEERARIAKDVERIQGLTRYTQADRDADPNYQMVLDSNNRSASYVPPAVQTAAPKGTFTADYDSAMGLYSDLKTYTRNGVDEMGVSGRGGIQTGVAATVHAASELGYTLLDAGFSLGRLGAVSYDSVQAGTFVEDFKNNVGEPARRFATSLLDSDVVRVSAGASLPDKSADGKIMIGTDRVGIQYKVSAPVDSVDRLTYRWGDSQLRNEVLVEKNFAKIPVPGVNNLAGIPVSVDVVPGARLNLSGNRVVTPSVNIDLNIAPQLLKDYKPKVTLEIRRSGS